jgi:N-acetylneuraminate synthase/N,N'-diacetyllegionaminate synthase
MYPINPEDANLNVMKRLKEITNLTIGYSDHTEGSKALYYATAMGAEVLEFHFTDSREGKQFRDHKVSLTPNEILVLIDEIKLIKQLQGSSIKTPVAIELDNGHHLSFRRAVYPSKDLVAGTILKEDDLTVLRPNHGIDAREFDNLIGKKIKTDVVMHQKLDWDLID